MAKIYRDFEELIQKNKHLFNILGDKQMQGFYRAIWSARDAEIDEYKSTLEQLQEDYKALEESLSLYKDESVIFEEEKCRFLQELSQKKTDLEEALIKMKNLQKQYFSLEKAQAAYKEITSTLEEDKKKLLSDIERLGQEGRVLLKNTRVHQEKNKRLYGDIETKKLHLKRLRSLYKKETNFLKEENSRFKESLALQQKAQKLDNSRFEETKLNHLLEINKLTIKLKEMKDEATQTTSQFEEKTRLLQSENAKKDAKIDRFEYLQNNHFAQTKQFSQKIDDLEQGRKQLYKELDYQRELVYSVTVGIDQKEAEIERLTSLFQTAQFNSKQYKHLNNKMSVEMAEMGRKVETLKIALN